jgi:hypothetical protein
MHHGSGTLETALLIQIRLQDLKQEVHIEFGETAGTINHQRITSTAELYRIATLLYLYQVTPQKVTPDGAVQQLVRDGFRILDQMEICTSPWPLFILACNVTLDVDRQKILVVLNTGRQKRRIGNYHIIKSLIQAVWKQQDLYADKKTPTQIDWRTLVDPTSYMPSFI